MKRGNRVVHGFKELSEKLGRNDPCPCGSGLRFQPVLLAERTLGWVPSRPLLLEVVAGSRGKEVELNPAGRHNAGSRPVGTDRQSKWVEIPAAQIWSAATCRSFD
ncbi:MAG: SEC-C metal-binding domain-containing protein [Blastocatellia bacterium]